MHACVLLPQLSERYLAAIARQLVTGLTYLHKELKVRKPARGMCACAP